MSSWRNFDGCGKGAAATSGALAMLDILVLGVLAASFSVVRPVVRQTVPAATLAFLCGAVSTVMFTPSGTGYAVVTLGGLLLLTHYGAAFLRKPSNDVNCREG